jgi:hypothetical protein
METDFPCLMSVVMILCFQLRETLNLPHGQPSLATMLTQSSVPLFVSLAEKTRVTWLGFGIGAV